MNYYNDIKNKLIDDEIYSKVKDYSKERHKVETYYEVGKMLSEAGKHYGEDIIGKYAERLKVDVGKKYDKSTLFKIRKFYLLFKDEKVAPLVPQLTWSHYLLLLPLKKKAVINYYINAVHSRNLSKRQLEAIIKSKEYERLSEEAKKKLVDNQRNNITDYIKNPIAIKNDKYKNDRVTERTLHNLIIENIIDFMKELGLVIHLLTVNIKLR